MWRAVLAVGVVVAACAGGVGAESFLQDISRNLRAEMAGVLEMANVTYSVPAINATYRARSEFDMRAMGSLYNSTHLIIDFIANKQAYPEGIVTVADGHVEVASLRDNWRTLLTHYAGPAAVIALAALLAAALPLAGLFWCCCYWCKSGRRRRAFDRKYDGCLKGMLAILLIALLTLFLFGVVCAFATDSQLESGAAAAPAAVRAGFADARTFLHATQAHARHLLTDNYRELDAKINALLTSAGLAVSVQLGQLSRAVSVSALEQLVRRLGGVQQDLRDVHRLTADLRTRADELNAGLRKVKGQLLQTLAQCEQPPCRRLQEKYKIGQLDTEIQYNQMPDVSELLANVTLVLDSNIQEEVADGQRVLTGIQRSVQRAVDTHVPSVQAAVADTGRRLARVADDISAMAGNASLQLQRHERAAAALQRAHQRYGPYRRIAGLGAAAALLAVVLAAALGLTCGVCGKRPDAYGASDCCNKGAGATALLCGTGLMFAVGGAVSCVALAYFAVGVAAQRFVCDPLTEPRGNRLFADVDRFVGLERALFNEQQPQPLTLSAVLQRCHGNHTIYETLQLRRLYDVDALAAEASRELAARAEALSPTYPAGGAVSILRPSARHKLRQLADAGLSDFDFDRILNALETNMTTLSLESLAVQLEDTARAVQPRSGYSRVAADLRAAAQALQQLQRQALTPLRAAHQQLQTTATKLRDGLRFNHTSLKEAVSYLMYETAQAELYLNTQGPELVQNMTRSFAGVVSALMQQYLRRLAAAARLHVGRCGPLSAAFNATRDAACRNILMPTNGYWVSVWWCALLLLPLAGASARLARLYRRVAAYPGPRDTEYLYDAYADRDNIPLANAYKAEKRAGRRARGEAGEGRGGGGAGGGAGAGGGGGGAGAAAAGAGPALAPPLDAHHARRYNDMAPKHWEEGPPRYLGPTEYERPPPYYYPGPNDRQ